MLPRPVLQRNFTDYKKTPSSTDFQLDDGQWLDKHAAFQLDGPNLFEFVVSQLRDTDGKIENPLGVPKQQHSSGTVL